MNMLVNVEKLWPIWNATLENVLFSLKLFACLIVQRKHKHVFTFYVILPYWRAKGNWNPPSYKSRTYLFCIVNIMVADVLATQGAMASATMILT